MKMSATIMALQIGLRVQQETEEGLGVALIGDPGVGKSARVKAIVNAMFRTWAHFSCSQIIPEAVAGIPYIRPGANVASFLPSGIFDAVLEAKPGEGCLIIDEAVEGGTHVQSAFQNVLTGAQLGTVRLPKNTAIVAMLNPPESSTTGEQFSGPMASRFCQLIMKAPSWEEYDSYTEDFFEAFSRGEDNPTPTPPIISLPPGWRREAVSTRTLVSAFLEKNGEYMLSKPSPENALDGVLLGEAGPCANSRSWLGAIFLLTACEALRKEGKVPASILADAEMKLLQGCISSHITNQFLAFKANWDLPSPRECLRVAGDKDAVKGIFEMYAKDNHKVLVICQNVVSLALEKSAQEKDATAWLAAWDFLLNAKEVTGKEGMIVRTVKSLMSDGQFQKPHIKKALKGKVPPAMRAFAPVIKAYMGA